MSPEASAESGLWSTDRTPYLKGVMEAVSDPAIEQVVLMSASQTGKTELLLNIIGYHIAHDASPILMVQPTLEMAQAWSKDRLAPMLRDTPALRNKVSDPRSRDSGNTTLHKVFTGGHITACGANSPSSLASRPIRICLLDEVSRFPASAGSEGDPVRLASRRSVSFWNRKIVLVSTPTIKGICRITDEYEKSDQSLYWVMCPHCEEQQVMRWSQVKWPSDKPDEASYVCESCESHWSEPDRIKAIACGEWKKSKEVTGIAGFHLSGLCSPWITIPQAVREFLNSKDNPNQLQTWVNTYLAETWEDEGDQVDDMGLFNRREDYGVACPEKVLLIVAGADVQDDRVEITIQGFGRDQESYVLDHVIIWGDPSGTILWDEVTEYLQRQWENPSGKKLRVQMCAIDSGGHYTQSVYDYSRRTNRVIAIKGIGGEGKPILGRASRNNSARIPLYPIGVNPAKELIYSRLKQNVEGAGYIHFPKHLDEEYFRQLGAEKLVKRFHKGYVKREWIKIRTRNESLDCMAYALGAYYALNIRDINKIADRSVDKIDEQGNSKVPRRRSGYVNAWKSGMS